MKHLAIVFALAVLLGCDNSSNVKETVTVHPEFDSVCTLISEQLGVAPEEVQAGSTLGSLGADDLDLVEVVMALEDAYEVSISNDVLMKVAGVSASETLVEELSVAGLLQVLDASEPQTNPKVASSSDELTGTYAELVLKSLPDDHVILFIPSLAALLKNAEDHKGQPLSEQEVVAIRDRAAAVATPSGVIEEMNQARGYEDIDPALVWMEWQKLRVRF